MDEFLAFRRLVVVFFPLVLVLAAFFPVVLLVAALPPRLFFFDGFLRRVGVV